MSGPATPFVFRQVHGDPTGWCGAEFDEYLSACDLLVDVRARLTAVVDVLAAGGSTEEALEVFRALGTPDTDDSTDIDNATRGVE
ncbi:hypothetical protein [Streptomyces abyssomicinicus]|uniref:hypothetical protein n=1 Tax=Streptomyces abyssomicinicus TaxID=574929 RepID=UPI00125070CF|nr:hypothetical protein [Streptomyces abyssomicinicus]